MFKLNLGCIYENRNSNFQKIGVSDWAKK